MEVQLLITCLNDALFPEVGMAVVETLEALGHRISFPADQTCCGQPAFNAGYWDDARPIAKHTISVLGNKPVPLVVPSGSCAAMLRHGYPELFQDDAIWGQRARELARRTHEFSEFLCMHGSIPESTYPYTRLAYHPSCHLLRMLGIRRQPLELLQSIQAIKIIPLPEDCCGFGGVFAVDHAPISSEMVKRKIEAIEQADVEGVVACDVSCLMQIEGALRKRGSPIRCAHIAQVLVGQPLGLR
ncbi:MAG: (Fe-S)-binding protein [Anaerolineales bacterium]